jgi:hypothetical protein
MLWMAVFQMEMFETAPRHCAVAKSYVNFAA